MEDVGPTTGSSRIGNMGTVLDSSSSSGNRCDDPPTSMKSETIHYLNNGGINKS